MPLRRALNGCSAFWKDVRGRRSGLVRINIIDSQPSTRSQYEARALADKYDLEFFDSILAQTLLRLASTHPKPAATVVGVAFAMDDQVLCEYAVAHLAPHQNPPHLMSCEFTKAIGPAAMGALASAYLMCESFCPCHHHRDPDGCAKRAWTGSREQWAELARYMPRSKIWISKWHK
jgi:hypothetical protein